MNIYVGNMSFETTEDEIRQAFESYGEVSTVKVITDKDSGQSKGFGFVEMSANDEATAAITALNGQDLNGRSLKVDEAKPRPQSGNRSNGNNYRKAY